MVVLYFLMYLKWTIIVRVTVPVVTMHFFFLTYSHTSFNILLNAYIDHHTTSVRIFRMELCFINKITR